ncbi:hypothetical protein F4778DRAFT_199969 [Xylariomycetidae sp. FL2044]|nr:hypothetical protein F4778DRAFT_199969 [Xylariomycetidae sp. FL2044]
MRLRPNGESERGGQLLHPMRAAVRRHHGHGLSSAPQIGVQECLGRRLGLLCVLSHRHATVHDRTARAAYDLLREGPQRYQVGLPGFYPKGKATEKIYDHLCWHATQGHIPHPPDAPSPPANADDQPGYPRPPEMMLPPPLHVLHMPSFNARPGNTGTAPGAPSGTSQAGGTAGVGGTTSMKPPDKNPKPPSTGPGGLFSSGLVAPTSGAAPSSTGLFDGLIPVAPATGRKSGPSEKAKPPKPPKPLDFGIALDDFNPGPVPAHLKRKRKNDLGGSFDSDLTFRTPTFADSEPEEEHSERSAVNDPVGNLDPDAPRSPKKRATKKNGVKSKTPVAAASGRATRAQSAAPLSTESNEGALALAATTLPKTPAAKGGSPSKKVTTSTAKTPGTASRRTRAASAQVTLPMTMESATDECEATAAAPPTTRTRTRTQVKIVEQEVVQTPATAKRGRSKK